MMELMPGKDVRHQILESEDSPHRAEALVRTAARTLSAFQDMHLESCRRRTVESELERLPGRAEPIRLVAPELHRTIEALILRLRPWWRSSPRLPTR